MDIKTAIETAKKMKRCSFTGGYYCSLNGCDNCGNYFDAREELEMLDAFINKYEKVKDLYERYVDACSMCTTFNCDECYLGIVIKDLEEILNTIEGDNNV